MKPVSEQRINRELKTVRVMIGLYCRDHHSGHSDLCDDCRALWDYTRQRVERCPLRANKPTCLNCTVHCFKQAQREQIRVVMRYAGPRMVWRHPIMSLFHFLDGLHRPKSRPNGCT
jgi:predicted amidophosphoribosyltransferase